MLKKSAPKPKPAAEASASKPLPAFSPLPHEFESRVVQAGFRPQVICIHCGQRLGSPTELYCVERSYAGRVKE